jgi:hypothetical protein
MTNKKNLTESELIEEFKTEHIENVTKSLARNGELSPMVAIFAKKLPDVESIIKDNDYAVFIIPIPEHVISNNDQKKVLAEFIPVIFGHLENSGVEPLCYSWSSEAWMRMANTKGLAESEIKNIEKNWQDLEKTEILMTTFETKDSTQIIIDKITRNGKMPDEDGNLIDCISLERHDSSINTSEPSSVGGIFGNIFQNYLKSKTKKD